MCELLIEEGADIDVVDRAGQTPIMTAVICYNKDVHTQLLQWICVHLFSDLILYLVTQVALLLIRHGADVDVEDKEGYTVLGRASDEFRPILIDAAKAMLEG